MCQETLGRPARPERRGDPRLLPHPAFLPELSPRALS